MITNCNWCARYTHRRISKGTRRLGNEGTSRNNLKYSKITIGQIFVKTPWRHKKTCSYSMYYGRPSAYSQKSKIIKEERETTYSELHTQVNNGTSVKEKIPSPCWYPLPISTRFFCFIQQTVLEKKKLLCAQFED